MLRELYDLFEKKTELVLNKVLDGSVKSGKEEVKNRLRDVYQVPLLGIVPCFCDVLKAEGGFIFAQDKPDHPFTKIVEEMTNKIEGMS
jgi:MinD-like ATPase involved in chromosome partitioning or flagellar assembly